ncbi:hypothetical protein SELMODRAFT_416177 [Selaginella moellendorffii]|uniref:HNH nuclease domain-containing protein n=1 Tax=Selaginella moellendorffii TaxID=88036 RepID=D8RYB6_SELML|nr:hypothetical protein SELMODRAFT_416177 [Selaginella moellendorffii]
MGLEDIDDPANGLMLFSPIEYCFDRLQLCFLVDPESSDGGRDQIVCRVLDPSIRDRLLVSVAESRGNWSGSDDPELAALTFAAIDGARLKFITNHRPLREALNFHARQARLHAISRGWIDESWDFRDFYTDRERWEKMRIWIDQKLTDVD